MCYIVVVVVVVYLCKRIRSAFGTVSVNEHYDYLIVFINAECSDKMVIRQSNLFVSMIEYWTFKADAYHFWESVLFQVTGHSCSQMF
jgi:hypothetical protein